MGLFDGRAGAGDRTGTAARLDFAALDLIAGL
jgi:hypothetical protein